MSEGGELADLQSQLREFAALRGWDKVRTLKDLCLAVGIEVGELQELLLWIGPEEEQAAIESKRAELESEVADVFIYLLAIADRAEIDLLGAAREKMMRNGERFPAP